MWSVNVIDYIRTVADILPNRDEESNSLCYVAVPERILCIFIDNIDTILDARASIVPDIFYRPLPSFAKGGEPAFAR